MKSTEKFRAMARLLLVGLLLIAGLSACGGTGGEADTDVPEVTLDKRTNVSTLERTRVLSGTMEAGATVTVTADKADAKVGAITGSAGTWTCSIDLVPGVNTISVKATDATGNNKTLAFPLIYEVVTLDQVLPTTALADQTLRGTLATGASLTATIASDPVDPGTPVTPVISGNTWSLDLIGVVEGTYTLTLVGTDSAGQTTTLAQTLVIGSSLPLLTVNPATPVGDTVSLSGTATATATLSIVAPTGVTVGTITQPAGSGNWSCELSRLAPGRNLITITATATDGSNSVATAQRAVLYQP